MKTLYLDCSMGAAGDMLAAALLELQPDLEAALDELNALGIPGVEFVREPVTRCGIAATHLAVRVNGQEEVVDHDHHHEHEHDHHHHDHDEHHDHDDDGHRHEHDDDHDGHGDNHHHVHRSLADVLGVIDALPLVPAAADNARAVYSRIAAAEGRAHGCEVDLVHFHEVGALDAVADIVASCYLMARIAPEKVVASPVHVGFGSVKCAHGIMPVPAPATAILLEGVPVYSDGIISGELCTPTGAALLRHFVSEFGPMPLMRVSASGHGAGRKDFPRANIVRAMLGESGLAPAGDADEVLELACNIDDMTAEELAFAAETVRDAGALDVWMQPALMKKGRPGTIFLALCRSADHDGVLRAILKHTSTLGVRETRVRRTVLDREETVLSTPVGDIRCKTASGFGVQREKLEYDDLAAIARARGVSLAEVRRLSGR
ncbi:MAG: nickel pincer cofactor biosynthesis protein LarC [Kiritimatiellae bacterium]|nr:nickel pincer cofactor biosynthesis protein LarC [Kiritimatiellia bacterium]